MVYPELHFTGQVWRPPYEASSQLLQLTSGCTWHRCKFCSLYGSADFSGGLNMSHEYSVVSLNMKNLMSPTPRNCVLNAFILALNDSAEAFVSLCSK